MRLSNLVKGKGSTNLYTALYLGERNQDFVDSDGKLESLIDLINHLGVRKKLKPRNNEEQIRRDISKILRLESISKEDIIKKLVNYYF